MATASAVKIGPGLLYVAPIGTTEPTTGSGALPSATWLPLGYTSEGSTFTSETTIEDIIVAETLTPIRRIPTKRDSKLEVSLVEMSVTNWAVAMNGGTIGAPSGGFVRFDPPQIGSEQRLMLVWDADDHGERLLLKRVLASGAVSMAHKKAPDKSEMPITFVCELPDNTNLEFVYWGSAALNYDDPHS